MTVRRATDGSSLAQLLDEQIPDRPLFHIGQVTDIDVNGVVSVNLGAGNITVTRLLDGPVAVGDNVLVLRDGQQLTVLGPIATVGRPVGGVVAAVPSNSYSIVVTTIIGAITAFFPASYSPTVGDQVLLIWEGSTAVAFSRGQNGSPSGGLSTSVAFGTSPPGSLTPSGPKTGVNVFPAVDSGTRRDGAWRGDTAGHVLAGVDLDSTSANTGAWFTGNRPAATLPGVTVTDAWVWLARDPGGDPGPQTVHLYRVTDTARAATDLDFTADTVDLALDVGAAGWLELPAAFAQALVDNGGSVAVQAPAGPFVRLQGLTQSGMAGALKIAWRTDS